jgi:hypothetical protein
VQLAGLQAPRAHRQGAGRIETVVISNSLRTKFPAARRLVDLRETEPGQTGSARVPPVEGGSRLRSRTSSASRFGSGGRPTTAKTPLLACRPDTVRPRGGAADKRKGVEAREARSPREADGQAPLA